MAHQLKMKSLSVSSDSNNFPRFLSGLFYRKSTSSSKRNTRNEVSYPQDPTWRRAYCPWVTEQESTLHEYESHLSYKISYSLTISALLYWSNSQLQTFREEM
jgi:hypothetical protein